jgi:heme/copper-type cytochrome/quinol oxidase subunit 1
MLMSIQPAAPHSTFVDEATYNQLFTMHGSVMIWATPYASARSEA